MTPIAPATGDDAESHPVGCPNEEREMTPEIIKVVVDELFKALEEQFAGRPIILITLQLLHAAALNLLPLLVGKVNAATAAMSAPK